MIMNNKQVLINNLDKLHTTPMGIIRIKKNLNLDTNDVVEWLINKIKNNDSIITRVGKNWYIVIENNIITVNAYSYTIITAHKND